MKIGIIGTGYVGLVAAACFAHMGNDVVCMDIDEKKIEGLKRGIIPIYEPGLETLVKHNHRDDRLHFTTSLEEVVAASFFIFIAVGTPPDENGAADLQYVLKVAAGIGEYMTDTKIIIDKSTVPVGTADKVRKVILQKLADRGLDIGFDVVSNPEFLKEGDSINDFMKPDRVVIGTDNPKTAELMKDLYAPFAMDHDKLIVMDVRSAELTKYAANAMLATRISFMNEIANICERVGADITKVRLGIGSDRRIGYSFIYPGLGYGGSCFPKDVRALISTAAESDYNAEILRAVEKVNQQQRGWFAERVIAFYRTQGGLKGKAAAVWGLAFKPNTDDVRESPALDIIRALIAEGATIQAYDPEAVENARSVLGDIPQMTYCTNPYDALKGANLLILATEWHLFRNPDFDRMKTLMAAPIVFDGRNQYDPEELRARGFTYMCIGRK